MFMSELKITWPRSKDNPNEARPIPAQEAFAAVIAVSSDVSGVSGECHLTSENGYPVAGTTISFSRLNPAVNAKTPNVWIIHFVALEKPGVYKLRVSGVSKKGQVTPVEIDFEVEGL